MKTTATIILGKGRSGQDAARLAAQLGRSFRMLADSDDCPVPGMFSKVELVIISPGIPPDSPLYRAAAESDAELISELEFAARHFPGQYLAVTGTNGKTTTVEFTVHLLRALGVDAVTAGNIGRPFSDVVAAKTEPPPLVVLEVSSFQLELVERFAPRAVALLNIASDHLNRYPGGLPEYAAVKRRIFANVPAADRIDLSNSPENTAPPRFSVVNDTILYGAKPLFNYHETQLSGKHNLQNLLAALELVSRAVPEEKLFSAELRNAVCSFSTGRHRLEKVAEANGVIYINDSKATNPAAVVAALETFGNAQSKNIHLILGGMDKGMDFSPLRDHINKIKQACLVGEARHKILQLLKANLPCQTFDTFAAGVRAAVKQAEPGDIVLLSPGCASWDMFSDYRERGDRFRELVELS